jgi:hypothetical protein
MSTIINILKLIIILSAVITILIAAYELYITGYDSDKITISLWAACSLVWCAQTFLNS